MQHLESHSEQQYSKTAISTKQINTEGNSMTYSKSTSKMSHISTVKFL